MQRILIVIAALVCARLAAEAPSVYALSDSYKLNKEGTRIWSLDKFDLAQLRKKNHVWDADKKLVSLSGAKGETVAVQIILNAGDADVSGVNVSAGDLDGPGRISAKNVELFKTWYIKTERESASQNGPSVGIGWYPDALVPWECGDAEQYDGPPFAIEKNTAQAVWIDINIPRDAAAGEYKGSLEISGIDGKTVLALSLRVFNFEMPREQHNIVLMNGTPNDIWDAGGYWLGKDDKKKLEYEDELYRMSRRHRFTFGNMYFESTWGPAALYPKIKTDKSGAITSVDWTEYDKRWDRVLNPKKNVFGEGEPPIEYWRLPFVTSIKVHKAKRFPEELSQWPEFAKLVKQHWEEKGWDVSRSYVYLIDEPRIHELKEAAPFAKAIKGATTPPLPTQIAFLPQGGAAAKDYAATAFTELAGSVDRWLWSANTFNPALLREKLRDTDWIGFYQGNGPYTGCQVLDKDGLELRTWPWISWMHNLNFSCYYSCTPYVSEQPESKMDIQPNSVWFKAQNRPNGNQSKGIFIYPGGLLKYDKPIVNMRLKQIRRGQQDYEYMWLLSKKGKKSAVDEGVRAIINKSLHDADDEAHTLGRRGFWSTEPEKWDAQVRTWGEMLDAK